MYIKPRGGSINSARIRAASGKLVVLGRDLWRETSSDRCSPSTENALAHGPEMPFLGAIFLSREEWHWPGRGDTR
jgi:hypothetical protein